MFRIIIIAVCLALVSCTTIRKKKNPVYRPPKTDVELYSRSPERLEMLAYAAPAESYKGAVLFVHGGAWRAGGADNPFQADFQPLLEQAGLRSFSIEHRTVPSYHGEELVSDVQKAVEYLQANHARFRFPKDRVSIVGFSSGGHLAIMAALRLAENKENRVRCVVAYYAPLDLGTIYHLGPKAGKTAIEAYLPNDPAPSADNRDAILRSLSPMYSIGENGPPMLLIHGALDELVPAEQSQRFYERLQALKLPSKLIVVPNGMHNFNYIRTAESQAIEKQAVDFILQYNSP